MDDVITGDDLWLAVLDDYEAVLEALRRGERTDLPPFEPPGDAGPMPTWLQTRASELLSETVRLIAGLETERDTVAAEISALHRPQTLSPPTPTPDLFTSDAGIRTPQGQSSATSGSTPTPTQATTADRDEPDRRTSTFTADL